MDFASKGFWGVLTLFFLGSLVVLVITHANSFKIVAGTMFSGVNSLGTTLTGANTRKSSR
jgi:hypothetical protein